MLTRRLVLSGLAVSAMGVSGITRSLAQPRLDESEIIQALGYPVEAVPGEKALGRWEALRAKAGRTEGAGYPVIVGDIKELARLSDTIGFFEGVEPVDVIGKSQSLAHPADLYAKKREEHLRFLREYPELVEELGNRKPWPETYQTLTDAEFEEQLADWPDFPASAINRGPSTPFDILSGKPFETCYIAMLPASHGHEAPAYMRWGNWNDNPAPQFHIAALRKWEALYGAQLVAMSGDVLELKVARRPKDRREALELALDHTLYCSDIVTQGVGDPRILADTYLNSDWWYFWWD